MIMITLHTEFSYYFPMIGIGDAGSLEGTRAVMVGTWWHWVRTQYRASRADGIKVSG